VALNHLFLDMNSFFASVEQQDHPWLRGQPIAVAPVKAETTCCIAASYEAKRFGVKTGTPVHEARRLCSGIIVREARPHRYIAVHHQILEAVDTCVPIENVLSIDEMNARLLGEQRTEPVARRLAVQVKAAIAERVGTHLRCSIGLGPNLLLAKVAAEMQKPDGLTVIHTEELPQRLHGLELGDFPGIGPNMERRLRARGIQTVEQLCGLSITEWNAVWGSRIHAERWWRRLRGEDLPDPPTRRSSVGHSHVLPPQSRNETGAWTITAALLQKAAIRLRSVNCWTSSLSLSVSYIGQPGWSEACRLRPCQDTLTLLRALRDIWQRKPPGKLLKVGVVLGDLHESHNTTLPLFEEDRRLRDLATTMDDVQARFGLRAISFGSLFAAPSEIPTRIAFTRVPEV
jgi:DNA polymerase-4